MTEEKIISVGFEWPGNVVECVPLHSDRTHLDGDIIVFVPDISYYMENSKGKYPIGNIPALDDIYSRYFFGDCVHWGNELSEALNSGKTVFVFLIESQKIQLTNLPEREHFSNYDFLPVRIENLINRTIKEIRTKGDSNLVSKYWDLFSSYSESKIILGDPRIKTLLTTKGGEKALGGYYAERSGTMFFLPPLVKLRTNIESIIAREAGSEELLKLMGLPDDRSRYKDIHNRLRDIGSSLASCFIEIDRSIRENREKTPSPEWCLLDEYRTKNEKVFEKEALGIKAEITELQNQTIDMENKLENEAAIRKLLYEKGKPLEESVIEALVILGFKADNYTDNNSEFDAIFTSHEGRFLGEVEGRDNSAIAIEKLRQLRTNLDEDFNKEDVSEYAKGVLFGNAFRIKPLNEREEYFTTKCITTAKLSKIALVKTPDLFFIARYLKENDDPEFARKCREAIKNAEGEIVVFPLIPKPQG